VRDDAAVVLIPPGATVDAVIGVPGQVTTIARDPVRGLTLVRVPSTSAQVLTIREGLQPLAAPGYVAVAEANAAGTSLRPVFVGRSDGLGDPRWDTPLITIGRGAAADVGAPVFTLEGRLAGLLTSADGEPALVPAEIVMASVDRLLRGVPTNVGDIGVVVQALDARLAAATGVASGAAIAAVRADGPAAQLVAPGDVITAVNGQPIRTPEALRLRVAREAPGSALTLTVRRDGGFVTGSVTVRARAANGDARPSTAATPSPQEERPLGLTLRAVTGRGSEVLRVQPGSLAELSGLRAGDVVVSLRAAHAPTPEAITAAVAALKPGGAVFLSVERDGQPRLVALQR
jgi:serine protease Do